MKKLVSNLADIHVGEMIRQELKRQGRSITWLAQNVNCSRENLYKIFRRPWIYTDLLMQISEALNYNFFKVCSDLVDAKIRDAKHLWHINIRRF
jgi:lambda repressor-like predicted transcriptional regulator